MRRKSKSSKKPEVIRIDRVKRTSLVDDIIEKLISHITERGLEPGDKLPSERLLVEALGVSRFPLREALAQLQALGVISVFQGKGAFVSEFSAPDVLHKLSPILRCQADVSLLNIVEARLVVECQVVSLAAIRRSEEIIERLQEDLEGMEREIHNRSAFINHDMDFHEAIAEAAANPVLLALVAMLHNLMHIVQEAFPDTLEARHGSLEHHKQIYRAVKDRAPGQAEESMRNHLKDLDQKLREQNALASLNTMRIISEQPEFL